MDYYQYRKKRGLLKRYEVIHIESAGKTDETILCTTKIEGYAIYLVKALRRYAEYVWSEG